jgi:hypothetical protein
LVGSNSALLPSQLLSPLGNAADSPPAATTCWAMPEYPESGQNCQFARTRLP